MTPRRRYARKRPTIILLFATGFFRSKSHLNERIHDAHCLRADAGVRMDLLEDAVDVDAVGLFAALAALLAVRRLLLRLDRLLCALAGWLWNHDDRRRREFRLEDPTSV